MPPPSHDALRASLGVPVENPLARAGATVSGSGVFSGQVTSYGRGVIWHELFPQLIVCERVNRHRSGLAGLIRQSPADACWARGAGAVATSGMPAATARRCRRVLHVELHRAERNGARHGQHDERRDTRRVSGRLRVLLGCDGQREHGDPNAKRITLVARSAMSHGVDVSGPLRCHRLSAQPP